MFDKQIKTTGDYGRKQAKTSKASKPTEQQKLKSIGETFLRDHENSGITKELNEIKITREKLI